MFFCNRMPNFMIALNVLCSISPCMSVEKSCGNKCRSKESVFIFYVTHYQVHLLRFSNKLIHYYHLQFQLLLQ